MLDFGWSCFVQTVLDFGWSWLVQTLLGLLSFAALMAWWERRCTTKQLKKYVATYKERVEFKWRNQTEGFVLMHRVRAFELFLRNVSALQPRTSGAYKRVEQVRDVLEYFHREVIALIGVKHVPLPKMGEFPLPLNLATEAQVRQTVLEGLRALKWLRLEKPTERSNTEPS